MIKKIFVIFIALTMMFCLPKPSIPTCAATVTSVASVFADNMVLCRRLNIRVWGTGIEGSTIKVNLKSQTVSTIVVNGNWLAELSPEEAGGPYTLTVTAPDKVITYNNVMIGEVWLLGGQSNMSRTISGNRDGAIVAKSANYPSIRMASGGDKWTVCSPQTVPNFSALGYYFARSIQKNVEDIPIGLILTSIGGTSINTWVPGATNYNSNILPWLNYNIRGMLWYQGEADVNGTSSYATKLLSLINAVRTGFRNDELPFYYVQLPRFTRSGVTTWQNMRDAQLQTLYRAQNLGMAIMIDEGEQEQIHPSIGKKSGERLALIARALTYGQNIVYYGPLYKSMVIQNDKIILTFDRVVDGLKVRNSVLNDFQIAGSDNVFKNATAKIISKDQIEVSASGLTAPTRVRYAWSMYPTPSLLNSAGFPASPFDTGSAWR